MLHRDDTGIEHAELDRKLALFVGDDGKSELGNALRSLDVLNPPLQQRAVRFRTCAGDLLQAACTPVLSWWDDVSLQERAMVLTPRLANSGCILATDPSSVVHTGVKSLGWENRTAQLLFFLSRTHTHTHTHTYIYTYTNSSPLSHCTKRRSKHGTTAWGMCLARGGRLATERRQIFAHYASAPSSHKKRAAKAAGWRPVANPLVEFDGAHRGLGLEVGHNVSQVDRSRHG